MNNYSNGKIYQILCLETGERYIGSCVTTLAQRLYGHTQKSNRCSSRQIIERGNYKMSLLEECPCSNRKELNTRERYHFLKLENVNIRRPVRLEEDEDAIANETKEWLAEYRSNHKEAIADNRKVYNAINREKIVEYRKVYTAINREQIVEQKKAYHLKNKDVLNLKAREYRQANLEIMRERDRLRYVLRSEKHVCECGGRYTTQTKTRHMNTQKHLSRSKPS